jgi:hypothetical protein
VTINDTRPRGPRRGGPRRGGRATRRTTVVALLTAALLVVAGGSAWAYWTATASGTGTVATHTVTITTSGFGGLGATYRNNQLVHSGTFTVTNTGQVSGHASIGIETLGGGVPALMPVTVWPLASGPCTDTATPPSGAQTGGTWASFSLLDDVSLAAGQSVTYCVQTVPVSSQSLADASGSITATPKLTVIFDDDEGWEGTRTETATTTITTELIYPSPTVGSPSYVQPGLSDWFTIHRKATPTQCLDVSGRGGPGTQVIAWGCHSDSNQRWQIIPAPEKGDNVVRLRPRHDGALGTRLAVNGSGGVLVQNLDANADSQLWEFQQISSTEFQLVSRASGLCLSMGATSQDVQLTTSACSSADRQSQILTLTREPLTFTSSGTTLTFGFSGVNTGSSQFRIQRWTGSTWVDVGTLSGTDATSVSMTRTTNDPPRNAMTTYRIVDSATQTVIYDGIELHRNNGNQITAVAGVG